MSLRFRDWMHLLAILALYLVRASAASEYKELCRQRSGLIAHPVHCDKFLECTDGGQVVERACGPTLHFNDDKKVCDYPNLVNCQAQQQQLNDAPNKYEKVKENDTARYEAQPASDGARSYEETVYGQAVPNESYNRVPASYPTEGPASDVQSYCYQAIEEAKSATHQRLSRESTTGQQQTASSAAGPYSYVSNFLHTLPYAKSLTYGALACSSAIKLIQNKYNMPGDEVVKMLNERGMYKTMLKPLPGQYRPDTDLPVSPDYDYCPYPSNLECEPDARFRTFDGSCNNLKNTLLGRAMTPFRRLLAPKYADGVSAIRQSVTGQSLPGARAISHQLFTDIDRTEASHTTMALVFFSQFLDHDITRTATYKVQGRGDKLTEPECGEGGCSVSDDPLDPCLPIAIPDDDYDFAANKCLKFVRSMPVPLLNCQLGSREQLNQVTHWIDGSQVYGSSKKDSDIIRELSQPDRGRMATAVNQDVYSKPLLPKDSEAPFCHGNETIHCFKAGDGRVNENPGITSYHTVFIRQHNLLEEGLHLLNPNWNGDRLFQETRRIVGAILQHVTYNELLPVLVGQQAVQAYQLNLQTEGYYEGYNAELDSRIPNEFAAAAFRFGHTLLQERVFRANEYGQVNKDLWLSQSFNRPIHIHDRNGGGGVDVFIRGLSLETSQPFDWFFTKQITRSLFTANPPTGVGHDLTSINIQRGRDHGIGTYNDFREWCGLKRAQTFEDLATEIDYDFVQEIRRVYSHVDDIDLFPGGVSEKPVAGAVVGPTFACIIAASFRNLRQGDRYWYENKQAGFSPEQLQELRKVRLSRVLCLNSDSVTQIQPYVFLQPATSTYPGNEASQFNAPVPCDTLPDIDLTLWREAAY